MGSTSTSCIISDKSLWRRAGKAFRRGVEWLWMRWRWARLSRRIVMVWRRKLWGSIWTEVEETLTQSFTFWESMEKSVTLMRIQLGE
eukprot:3539744-Rhodomonas_salina.1